MPELEAALRALKPRDELVRRWAPMKQLQEMLRLDAAGYARALGEADVLVEAMKQDAAKAKESK